MDNFDRAISGPCERCGEPGTLQPDPYAQDVNNETVLVVLCDRCYGDRCDEI